MENRRQDAGLHLIDEFVAEARGHFTFDEAVQRAGRSRTGTANLLQRLVREGLIDRVRRGHYAIRQLGVLGTSAATEDVLLAVGAGFSDSPHRVGYRTALVEHDLLSHPSRSVQVASAKAVKSESLSGRPLTVVRESPSSLSIGAMKRGNAYVSDLERALLDSAARPDLVGGAAVLAEALASASSSVDPERLMEYARQLSWGAALRRIGSISDALDLDGLSHRLSPLAQPTGDIELEPGAGDTAWRDSRWWVRWAQTHEELASVARQ